eukprot:2191825-Amphidinium_carterae.1
MEGLSLDRLVGGVTLKSGRDFIKALPFQKGCRNVKHPVTSMFVPMLVLHPKVFVVMEGKLFVQECEALLGDSVKS